MQKIQFLRQCQFLRQWVGQAMGRLRERGRQSLGTWRSQSLQWMSLVALALMTCLCTIYFSTIYLPSVSAQSAPTNQTASNAFVAGQERYAAGDYAGAVNLLEAAIADYRTRGDRAALAIALSNLSLAQQQLGNWSAATQSIDESLTLLASLDPLKQVAILSIQGNLQLATGQTEAALQTWERIEMLYQQQTKANPRNAPQATAQLNPVEGLIQSRMNQAQALRILGFYGRARQRLEAAAALLPDPPPEGAEAEVTLGMRAELLRRLGNALRLSGNDQQAQNLLNQSLQLAQQLPDRRAEASIYLDLGNLYRSQDDVKAALQAYDQAIALAPQLELQMQAQTTQLSLLLSTQQFESAQEKLTLLWPQMEALPRNQSGLYSRIHLAQAILRPSILPPSADAVALPQLKTAILKTQALTSLLSETVEIARRLGDRRALSYAEGIQGHFYEQTQNLPRAIALTQAALRNAQRVQAVDISYRWNWQLGRLLAQSGDITNAVYAYDDAILDLGQLRSDLVSINRDIQFSFKESVEPVYRESVGLLIQAETQRQQQLKQIDFKSGFKSDFKSGFKSDFKSGFKSALNPSTKQNLDQQATSSRETSNLEKARARIEALQLAELDNFFREACLDGKSVALDKVVDQDNPTTAIIYPILLADRLEVIVKIPGEPELQVHTVRQSRESIEQTLRSLRLNLPRLSETRKVRQQAQLVYQWIFEPFKAQIEASKVDTLVFVLDGALRSVPMGVLYNGERYLVEDYAVGVSLGLQLLEPKAIAQAQLNILAAGLVQPPSGYQNYAELPYIENEFRLIDATGATNQQLLNGEFTRDRLAAEVKKSNFNVVHLATHGQFSSNAEDTFILAADGPIPVTELDDLLRDRSRGSASAIELLVLSACQTAAGDDRAALGLAGVAVKAGARSTLASLWQVDDRSTSILMGEFYSKIAGTPLTKVQALRAAQLSLLSDSELRAPAYWAPYVMVGNWL